MNKDKHTGWYLLVFRSLIALCVFCIPFYQSVLRAQDSSNSMRSLPSTSMTGTDLSPRCLECHKYGENHHPIAIAPSQPDDYPFPLYNGKIMCLTCHIEDHLGSVNLLRGGPYVDDRELCFKCHAEEKYVKIDPHIMLDNRGGILNVNEKSVCLFCHSVQPNPATDRTGDVVFRADVAFLCWRCHPSMANSLFFKEHFLVTPSMEMRRFIGAQEQRLQVTLPLVPRDRITCSTCHNPHQKGVIFSVPSASGADALHRLRLPSDKICIVCHNVM